MTGTCDPVFSRVDDLISLLGKSKLLHILFILNTKQRPMRFTEIKQRVDSSSTTVTRRLAELENNGLVTRVVHNTAPVSVEYELTKDAQNLAPPGNGPTVKGQTKVQVFPGQEGRGEAIATLHAAIEIANRGEQ